MIAIATVAFFFLYFFLPPCLAVDPPCLNKILNTLNNEADVSVAQNGRLFKSQQYTEIDKGDIKKIFKGYADAFKNGMDEKKVKKILKKIAKEKDVSQEDLDYIYGTPIAVSKKLRNAFICADRSHEVPSAINELSTAIGHVKDGFFVNDKKFAAENAAKTIAFLEKKGVDRILKEIDKFKVSDSGSLKVWINVQSIEMKKRLGSEKITPRVFHEIRKIVARLEVLYSAKLKLASDPSLKELHEKIFKSYTEMGLIHDELMLLRISKKIDYENDLIPFSPEIKKDLQVIAELLAP